MTQREMSAVRMPIGTELVIIGERNDRMMGAIYICELIVNDNIITDIYIPKELVGPHEAFILVSRGQTGGTRRKRKSRRSTRRRRQAT